MKKIFYTLALIGYLFSVSSLTHVFAMTDEISFHHDSHHSSMNQHGCGDYSKSHESDDNSKDERNSDMNCCEILFSSGFSYVKIELDSPDDNYLEQPIRFNINNLVNDFNIDSNNEVFSPPGWETKEKKFTTYGDLTGIIKNLN